MTTRCPLSAIGIKPAPFHSISSKACPAKFVSPAKMQHSSPWVREVIRSHLDAKPFSPGFSRRHISTKTRPLVLPKFSGKPFEITVKRLYSTGGSKDDPNELLKSLHLISLDSDPLLNSAAAAAAQVIIHAEKLDPSEALYQEGVAYRDEAVKISKRKDEDKNPLFVRAFSCFTQAANKGHAHAMYSLGILYQYGRGTKKNESEALKWYAQSATHGNVPVLEQIGHCHQEGIGTPIDLVKAYTYYRRFGWLSPKSAFGNKREMPELPHLPTSVPGTKDHQIASNLKYLKATYELPIQWDSLLTLFKENSVTFDIWIRDQELHDKMKGDLTKKSTELSESLKTLKAKVVKYIKEKVPDIKLDTSNKNRLTIYDMLKLINSRIKA